ncbi:HigA family addiction module antitoxin [Parabacteroides timonensis]|uniref:HigA family addiction module antitoxin n=1 Tax=Parabacteroides timonensis TaxID=1871013 RepID=UPI00094E8534|nr:HigA family addiction module antitoxin [Parabacteroides timonensis]
MGNLGYSFIPYHPGELLKEELECRKIKQKDFALKIGVSTTLLNDILNAKRPVTAEFALLMEAALGINADLLVKMQARYTMQIARANEKNQTRWQKIREICASLL